MAAPRFPCRFDLLLWSCGGLILLFVIAPLAGMVLHCSGATFVETVSDAEVRRSIGLTLGTSFAGASVFALAAVPFAYLLARRKFPLKRFVIGIIDLPVIIPHSTAGIALIGVLGRDSLPGRIAGQLGFSIIDHPVGIALAMAFVSLPFLIAAARDGFAAVPVRLEKAALTLGASPMQVFFTIALPLARRSIITGFVLMFARGLSEFGAVIIVAYHPMITPVLIYERFTSFGLAYARGVAVVFLLVSLMMFVALRWLSGGRRHVAD